ncbi:MAG: 3-dehydroquinate synthase [Acidobacteriota bacterium]|nr:3-dehydroquinate synthase [Acidobacteriota bacterium]
MRFSVDLAERSYEVEVAVGARRGLSHLIAQRAPEAKRAAIVTSPSLRAQPWFDLETGIDQVVLEVPDGEDAKDVEVLGELLEALAREGLSRRDVVVCVGGGAVTDLGGFAAAVYLRGVALVQVPTSLVGQVDAAIGGKTGVNLAAGKNLAGAFHQPLGVLADVETLATLPERDRVAGFGEVAKCWLLEERRRGDLDGVGLEELIGMAVGLKAAIVSVDETEQGPRALLNYGHTLGHALERLALDEGRDALRHGEAVAVGLAFAARLAHSLGRVDAAEVVNHDEVLERLGLGARVPERFATADLVAAMAHDKKAHHDLAFVLAGPEGFEVVRGIAPDEVIRVLDNFRGE